MDFITSASPRAVILIVWSVWAVSWLFASVWSARTVKRPAVGTELFYRIITVVGFVLIFGWRPDNIENYRFWHVNDALGSVLI